jgi:NAD(P)-dependent dehydrogenase (short-subunit alcohol dehydrogenase family)
MSSRAGVVSSAMTQLLSSKNAIVYGAGGSLGSAVARTFAREGARVFLAGRTRKLDVLRLRGRVIAEVTTFNAELFGQFGLPAVL